MHDNADTLAHLMGIGWDNSDRRKWGSIKNVVESFGLKLQDNGAIVGTNEKAFEQGLISRFVCAMLAIVDFEREYFGLTEEQELYIHEVEMALRASKPTVPLALYPAIEGHSGRTHSFHFDFDGALIDASKPHGGRTGSILRKAADVINAGIQKKILVVMDDREETERAKAETDILSTMVSVMQFTDLAALGHTTATQH